MNEFRSEAEGIGPHTFPTFFSHGNFVNRESLYVDHPQRKPPSLFSDLEQTNKTFQSNISYSLSKVQFFVSKPPNFGIGRSSNEAFEVN